MDIYGLPYILLRDLRISTGWSWYIKSKQWLKSLDQSELVNVNLHDETDGFFLEPIIYESVPLPNITQYHPPHPSHSNLTSPNLTHKPPSPACAFSRRASGCGASAERRSAPSASFHGPTAMELQAPWAELPRRGADPVWGGFAEWPRLATGFGTPRGEEGRVGRCSAAKRLFAQTRLMGLPYLPTLTPKPPQLIGKYGIHGASGICDFL